jgi:DNA-binding transcriptional regulator GbsR (MarR family)
VGIGEVAEWSSLSAPTVSAVFQQMEDLGMVREITGNQRNRLYAYTAFINILSDGID